MNVSLNNPYGDVTIPRAKLRTQGDSSTVIMNPMALDNRNSALNPYGNFNPQGEGNPAGVPVYGIEARDGTQNPPPYTVKVDDEQVGRCNACCYRCRRKK